MKPQTILEKGLKRFEELQEFAVAPAQAWLTECSNLGYLFTVAEVHRTAERQWKLYQIGRTKELGKPKVTWTLTSDHTRRLAADVYPVDTLQKNELLTFYKDIEEIGRRYGIKRDPALVKLGDYGHFIFHNAKLPVIKPLSPKARLSGLRRRFQTSQDPAVKASIQRQIERLEARLRRQKV